jgi:hypothetical protein
MKKPRPRVDLGRGFFYRCLWRVCAHHGFGRAMGYTDPAGRVVSAKMNLKRAVPDICAIKTIGPVDMVDHCINFGMGVF